MTHDSSYAKPFKTVREQVSLLASRGMEIGHRETAEALLERIGYYRISGYWYPFRERVTNDDGNRVVLSTFRPGTTLEHVCAIYGFDRELRAALFDALEAVEVAIRFQVGHTLGRRHIFAHREPTALDPGFAAAANASHSRGPRAGSSSKARRVLRLTRRPPETRHQEWLRRFDEQERRSQEAFATHFRSKYGPHLPVWVATEVMTFGTLAQLYDGAAQHDRERIAASLDIIGPDGKGDASLLSNWLNHIRYIRNLCAHHSRTWNRSFDVELASAAHIPDLHHLTSKSQRRLYGTISVLAFLLARAVPDSTWRTRIRDLIEGRSTDLGLDLDAMGFPADWDAAGMWGDDYRRDPTLARRVALITGLDLASTLMMRDRLQSRAPKRRRSWLNYLKTRHALVWVSMGQANLFPGFQIDHTAGDIRPEVGDINEELYGRLTDAGLSDEDARWTILEWWLTPAAQGTLSPVEILRAGTLKVADARASFPQPDYETVDRPPRVN